MTTDEAIARLERRLPADEIFTLQRVSAGKWEAWTYEGDVGRGDTVANAIDALLVLLR